MSAKPIFVFGSNRQGRHGKGDALIARTKYGAIYGQAEGLQGNSYAIITKELRQDHKIVTLKEIKDGVKKFLKFAKKHKELTFRVRTIGCGLAGRTPKQIGPMFYGHPKNVILPKPFVKYCRKLEDRFFLAWKKKHGLDDLPVRQLKFLEDRKFTFDFAWPDYKVAVEIHGGSFTGGRHNHGFWQARDFEKHNIAVERGWIILYFNTMMLGTVDSGRVFRCVKQTARVIQSIIKGEWYAG